MHRIALALAALLIGAGSGHAAAAQECPYPFGAGEGADQLLKGLEAAPTCEAAYDLHNICAWGSSADAMFAQVVIPKCEASFLSGLSPAQTRAYKARLQHCTDKYAHEEGTMFIAFAASCQEEVALAFATNATAASRVKVPRLPVVKASFDCRKARQPLELVICSEDRIGAADIALSQAYATALQQASAQGRAMLTRSERGWLDFVATKCDLPSTGTTAQVLTRGCVRGSFEARRDQIGLCLAKPAEQQAACLGTHVILPSQLPK